MSVEEVVGVDADSFFVRAEEGIRGWPWSCGLGDVVKGKVERGFCEWGGGDAQSPHHLEKRNLRDSQKSNLHDIPDRKKKARTSIWGGALHNNT